MHKKAVVHLHNKILPGCKKQGALTLRDSMDGPGEYYDKQTKPVGGRQVTYDLRHV